MVKIVIQIFKFIALSILLFGLVSCDKTTKPLKSKSSKSPTASEILGNPNYPAFSYGGYSGKSRDITPTHEEITEDLKILAAMGVKVLRTYNT